MIKKNLFKSFILAVVLAVVLDSINLLVRNYGAGFYNALTSHIAFTFIYDTLTLWLIIILALFIHQKYILKKRDFTSEEVAEKVMGRGIIVAGVGMGIIYLLTIFVEATYFPFLISTVMRAYITGIVEVAIVIMVALSLDR